MVLFCHQWKWKGSKYFCKQFQRGSLSLDLWCDFEEIDFKKIEFRQFCKFEFLATMLNDVKSKGISNESFFYCNFAHHKETKWWKFNSFICRFFKNHCWKTWNLLSLEKYFVKTSYSVIKCNVMISRNFYVIMVRVSFRNFYTVKTLSFPFRKFLMKRCIRNWSFFSSFEWNMWALKFMGVSEYPKAKEVVVVLCTSTYIGPNINNP